MKNEISVLFEVNQLGRRPEFAISTTITQEGTAKLVLKRGHTAEATAHLHKMLSSHAKLRQLTAADSALSVVSCSKTPNGISSPYIEGRNVERILFKRILDKDFVGAEAIIDRYLNVLDSLRTTAVNPSDNPEFTSIFGNVYRSESTCITPGAIDFNLDNFIEAPDGTWHLIDYEWVFDFPVPKDYLIARFFYNFFVIRYQTALRIHAQRINQVYIYEDVTIPAFMQKKYSAYFSDLKKVSVAESAFQKYVTGKLKALPKLVPLVKGAKRIYTFEPSAIQQLLESPTPSRIKELEGDNERLAEDLRVARQEIEAIKNSRGYQALEKARKLKNFPKR